MGARKKYYLLQDSENSEKSTKEVIGVDEEKKIEEQSQKRKKKTQRNGSKKNAGKFLLWMFVVLFIVAIVVVILLAVTTAPNKKIPNSGTANQQKSSTKPRNVSSLYAVLQDGAVSKQQQTHPIQPQPAVQRSGTMYAAAQAYQQQNSQESNVKTFEQIGGAVEATSPQSVTQRSPQPEPETVTAKPKKSVKKPKMVCRVLKNDSILYSIYENGRMIDCYALSNWDGNGISVKKGQTIKSYDTKEYDGITYFRYGKTNKYINSLADSLKCERVAQ